MNEQTQSKGTWEVALEVRRKGKLLNTESDMNSYIRYNANAFGPTPVIKFKRLENRPGTLVVVFETPDPQVFYRQITELGHPSGYSFIPRGIKGNYEFDHVRGEEEYKKRRAILK